MHCQIWQTAKPGYGAAYGFLPFMEQFFVAWQLCLQLFTQLQHTGVMHPNKRSL